MVPLGNVSASRFRQRAQRVKAEREREVTSAIRPMYQSLSSICSLRLGDAFGSTVLLPVKMAWTQ